MNILEEILYWLQGTMERPKPYGWFHLMWISLVIGLIIILLITKKRNNEKRLKVILGVYGFIALLLELIKQVIWSFNYDLVTNFVNWDYQWYSFPFQLCSTPIFISLICLFMKKNKVRNSLLSYMAFVTILGSLVTMIIPDSCFVETIEVNIHTMWLHCGSFVVSIYLLMSKEVSLKKQNLIQAILVFLIFVSFALLLNIIVYNLQILNGEEFNMFYISPYFVSTLPVFNILQESLPYPLYLLTYVSVIITGACFVYFISLVIKTLFSKKLKMVK